MRSIGCRPSSCMISRTSSRSCLSCCATPNVTLSNPEFQKDMLGTIQHVVDRMNRLLLQLRSGTTPIENAKSVDLGPIVERVTTAHSGGGHNIGLKIQPGLRALGHEERLERVLGHLGPERGRRDAEGGQVSVSAYRETGHAVIEVSDTGQGMSPEFVREHLFRPFQSTKPAGMGIGAYESHRYVTELGGRIIVDSAPGAGPGSACCCPSPQHGEQRCRAAPAGGRMSDTRRPLLIVDDDPALQKQMQWAFDGYEVLLADDHDSALAQLRRYEPAVVTVDLGLPPHPDEPTEGLRLLQEILALAPDAKVIVITGQHDRGNALKCIALGAYDFCEKPVQAEILSLVVERAFRLYELQEENQRLQTTQDGHGVTGILTRDPRC